MCIRYSLCGTSVEDFNRICDILASTSVPDRTATILYALGWTHHSAGAQIIRAAGMLQLLLGNIGMAGGGVNAVSYTHLRAHETKANLVCRLLLEKKKKKT